VPFPSDTEAPVFAERGDDPPDPAYFGVAARGFVSVAARAADETA